MNITNISINGYNPVIDCGVIKSSFASKVNFVFITAWLMVFVLFTTYHWAINKVIKARKNNKITDEEVEKFQMIIYMAYYVSIMMYFIMTYWLFLSGIDY